MGSAGKFCCERLELIQCESELINDLERDLLRANFFSRIDLVPPENVEVKLSVG